MKLVNLHLHKTGLVIGFTVLHALILSGCGGGDGDAGSTAYNPLWVYIDSTDSTVQTSSVDLHGKAYCDNCPSSVAAFGYCPQILGPLSSSIDVTWKNRTTGATGNTIHGIYGSCSCLFSYCFTTYSFQWLAYGVPLDTSENVLEAIVSDLSGASAKDTVAITRIPATPVELSVLAGKGEITLNWNSVAEATSYDLYWSTSSNLTATTGTKIEGITSPYVHNGLTDDVTYYYFVTALIGGLESTPSPIIFATSGWRSELIAPTTSSTDMKVTSIAMDQTGNTHIHDAYNECTHYTTLPTSFTYCDSYNYYNEYITDTTGSWSRQSIGTSPFVDANIAIDSVNSVHVGYADNFGIAHKVYSSGAWTAEEVDAEGWCKSSLALDTSDNVYFAYFVGGPQSQELRYATNKTGTWVHGTVDLFTQDIGCGAPESPLSLAVDVTGVAHIIYAGKYPDYGLKYASNQGGTWTSSTIDTGNILKLSAVVGANGKIHAAYYDNAHNIKYAHQDASGAWIIEFIFSDWGGYPSLALDSVGKGHISYISGLNGGQIIYASNATGTWRFLPVDAADFTDTAIALDSQGKAHISYFNGGNLKNATNN